jgi:putative PIG3 family NAD(P)H quinone oxidoreductase
MEQKLNAILVNETNELVWSPVPDPVRKDNEVIIDIHAAALNRADLMQRAGNYPPPPGWPEWMGLEVSGVIAEASADSRWQVGDKVCALLGGGGYAEKVAVPEDMVLPIPEGLSFVEAATIPEAFLTSYLNIFKEAGMKPGDMVFIQAGASGLGVAAIQLVKALGGKVMTTVSTPEKAEFVRKLGADIVVNRTCEDLAEVMAQYPVDIGMDCVAGENLGKCLSQMAPGGRWVIIATLGGQFAELDMLDFFKRGVRLIGSTLRSRTSEMKAQLLSELQNLIWAKLSSREIELIIHKSLPITQAEEAHAILQRRENIGKVMLKVGRS